MIEFLQSNVEVIVTAFIIVAFIGTVIGTMIYNPNYSVKQIIKNPKLFFDLLEHSWERLQHRLEKAEKSAKKASEKYEKNMKKMESIQEELSDKVKDSKNNNN